MPTYDYECPECGRRIEATHGSDETPNIECPECGAAMKKLMPAPHVFRAGGPTRRGRDYIKREINRKGSHGHEHDEEGNIKWKKPPEPKVFKAPKGSLAKEIAERRKAGR